MQKNKVLILLDGSEFRRRILPHVQRFLRPDDTELILFRVVEVPRDVYLPEGPIIIDVYDDKEEAALTVQIREEMLATKETLEEVGYEVHREVRFGGVAREIEAFIDEAGIDLVTMTTRGRTGISKLFYGSVAEHVLHNVTIPVMLVRTADS